MRRKFLALAALLVAAPFLIAQGINNPQPNQVPVFHGRLTLTTGTPVLAATVSAATTLYYTPYVGQFVTLYNGTNMLATDTGGELAIALGSNWAANSNYDVYVGVDSGTLRLCTGAVWSSDTARAETQTRVNGVLLNTASMTCRYNNTTTFTCAASRCSYVGTIRTGSAGQTNFVFGSSASGGGAATLGVCNYYNRVRVRAFVQDSTTSWSYSSATVRAANGSNGNRVSFVSCFAEDAPWANYLETAILPNALAGFSYFGHGLDSTSTMVCRAIGTNAAILATNYFGTSTGCYYAPQVGFHFVQAMEAGDGTNSTTFLGNGALLGFEFAFLM